MTIYSKLNAKNLRTWIQNRNSIKKEFQNFKSKTYECELRCKCLSFRFGVKIEIINLMLLCKTNQTKRTMHIHHLTETWNHHNLIGFKFTCCAFWYVPKWKSIFAPLCESFTDVLENWKWMSNRPCPCPWIIDGLPVSSCPFCCPFCCPFPCPRPNVIYSIGFCHSNQLFFSLSI